MLERHGGVFGADLVKCAHIANEASNQPQAPRWKHLTVKAYRISRFEINEMRDLDSLSVKLE